jgi:hypothetical protein
MTYPTTIRYLLIPLGLAACSADRVTSSAATRSASASPSFSSSSAVEHSLTGNGIQDIFPGFSYGFGGAIHSDGNGRVWGTIIAHLYDLSAFGISGTGEFQMSATCLRVVGNAAYAGLVVTKSTGVASPPPGTLAVLWVQDGGPGAPDVAHSGPADLFDPNNLICSDTPPAMPADPVTSGNFVVQ